jgi:hypothetical protein
MVPGTSGGYPRNKKSPTINTKIPIFVTELNKYFERGNSIANQEVQSFINKNPVRTKMKNVRNNIIHIDNRSSRGSTPTQ